MRPGYLFSRNNLPALAALALFTLPLPGMADSIPQKEETETLALDSAGNVEVNGVPLESKVASKPTQLHAIVEKVVEGPEDGVLLFLRPIEARRFNGDGSVEVVKLAAEARPFLAEAEWKMINAEGQETLDPRFAQHVFMPYPMDLNAALFEVKWNECQGPITGNYSGYSCNQNRGLANEFMDYLKGNFLSCVNQGLGKVGLPAVTKAHIEHNGTIADSRHNRKSLHAVGRAVDIQRIYVTPANGQKITLDFRVTSSKPNSVDRKFYEGFRSCWHNLQMKRSCPSRSGGPTGTIGWEDGEHRGHHLHTSMPFCPNNKGYFITGF